MMKHQKNTSTDSFEAPDSSNREYSLQHVAQKVKFAVPILFDKENNNFNLHGATGQPSIREQNSRSFKNAADSFRQANVAPRKDKFMGMAVHSSQNTRIEDNPLKMISTLNNMTQYEQASQSNDYLWGHSDIRAEEPSSTLRQNFQPNAPSSPMIHAGMAGTAGTPDLKIAAPDQHSSTVEFQASKLKSANTNRQLNSIINEASIEREEVKELPRALISVKMSQMQSRMVKKEVQQAPPDEESSEEFYDIDSMRHNNEFSETGCAEEVRLIENSTVRSPKSPFSSTDQGKRLSLQRSTANAPLSNRIKLIPKQQDTPLSPTDEMLQAVRSTRQSQMIDLYKSVKGDEPLKLIPPPEQAVNARGEPVSNLVDPDTFKKQNTSQADLETTYEMIDESAIMGNLFYLNTEKPEKVTMQNNVSQVLHKAMNYTCVDGSGPTKKIQIELVDLLEKVHKKSEEPPKKRSLIFMKITPNRQESVMKEDDQSQCQDTEPPEFKSLFNAEENFADFESMYNQLTEKLITRVIASEQVRADQVSAETHVIQPDFIPKCFLLIGEDDNNMMTAPTFAAQAQQAQYTEEQTASPPLQPFSQQQVPMSGRSILQVEQQTIKEVTEDTSPPLVVSSRPNPAAVVHDEANINCFDKLYEDSQRQRSRLQERQVAQRMQKEAYDKSACTFQPNNTGTGLNYNSQEPSEEQQSFVWDEISKKRVQQPSIRLRSAEQFYNDQMTYKYKTETRLQAQREAELKEVCKPENMRGRKRANSKGGVKSDDLTTPNSQQAALVFERLSKEPRQSSGCPSFKLDLAKLHQNTQQPTPRLTSSRSAEKLTSELFHDAMKRQQRAEQIQIETEKNIKNQAVAWQQTNLRKSKILLANKVAQQATEIFKAVGLEQRGTSQIKTFDLFKTILAKLDYLKQDRIVQDANLVVHAWDLLKIDADEVYVSLTNFVTFIIAVENLFVEQMMAYPNLNKKKKKFGYFINDRFFVESEAEVRAMHSHFYAFFLNKNEAVEKKKEEQMQTVELTFNPTINKRSKSMGATSAKRSLFTRPTLEKKSTPISPVQEYPLSAKSRSRSRNPATEFGNYRVSRRMQTTNQILEIKENRLNEKRQQKVQQEMNECTFKPKTLRYKKNLQHQQHQNQRKKSQSCEKPFSILNKSTGTMVMASKSVNRSARGSNLSTSDIKSLITTSRVGPHDMRNRAEQIKQRAREKKKLYLNQMDSSLNDQECTFKPNLAKTSKSNSNVISKHWLPHDKKKGSFSVTRQSPFSAQNKRKRAHSSENLKSNTARHLKHEIFNASSLRQPGYAEKYGFRKQWGTCMLGSIQADPKPQISVTPAASMNAAKHSKHPLFTFDSTPINQDIISNMSKTYIEQPNQLVVHQVSNLNSSNVTPNEAASMSDQKKNALMAFLTKNRKKNKSEGLNKSMSKVADSSKNMTVDQKNSVAYSSQISHEIGNYLNAADAFCRDSYLQESHSVNIDPLVISGIEQRDQKNLISAGSSAADDLLDLKITGVSQHKATEQCEHEQKDEVFCTMSPDVTNIVLDKDFSHNKNIGHELSHNTVSPLRKTMTTISPYKKQTPKKKHMREAYNKVMSDTNNDFRESRSQWENSSCQTNRAVRIPACFEQSQIGFQSTIEHSTRQHASGEDAPTCRKQMETSTLLTRPSVQTSQLDGGEMSLSELTCKVTIRQSSMQESHLKMIENPLHQQKSPL